MRTLGTSLVTVAMLGMTIAAAQTNSCKPSKHGDWTSDCIRLIASTDVRASPDATPSKIVVAYDGEIIRVFAVMPLSVYRRFFTNTPPTAVALDGTPYVHDDLIFSKHRPPLLRVGKSKFSLEWDGNPHWHLSSSATKNAIAAIRNVPQIEIEYSHAGYGAGYRSTVRSLGLSSALEAFHQAGR